MGAKEAVAAIRAMVAEAPESSWLLDPPVLAETVAHIDALEAKLEQITELVKAAELRSLQSLARTFEGLPFPAIVLSADLRAILEPATTLPLGTTRLQNPVKEPL